MEVFDVVDEQGNPTGRVVERGRAHREGILHRTAHVWLIDAEGASSPEEIRILLQKRSRNKDSFPGCYDTSSAGHVPAGCEVVDSACRELKEELGLEVRPEELQLLSPFRVSYQKEFHGSIFHDEEVAFVYLCRKKVNILELTLQKEEVESVRWFTLEELTCLRRADDPSICVPRGGLKILTEGLRKLDR